MFTILHLITLLWLPTATVEEFHRNSCGQLITHTHINKFKYFSSHLKQSATNATDVVIV